MIGIYKKTITLCVILLWFSFLLSLCLYMLHSSFLINYFIGIGSSAIVVMATTYLQYRREQYNRYIELDSAIYDLLTNMFFLLSRGYSDDPEKDYTELEKSMNTIAKLSTEDMKLFTKIEDTPFSDMAQLARRLITVSSGADSVEIGLDRLIKKQYYVEIIENAIRISRYDFEKESYESKLKMINEIERIRKKPASFHAIRQEHIDDQL